MSIILEGSSRLDDLVGSTSAPLASKLRLELNVLHTRELETLTALHRAEQLAQGLNGFVRLIVPVVVPFPLPLSEPPIRPEVYPERLRSIINRYAGTLHLLLLLCRDREEALQLTLRPNSLLIIGGSRHWWKTAEKRLASHLERLGHRIIFIDTGGRRKCSTYSTS